MQSSLHDTPVMAAVITGGHPFDVPNLHRLFRGMPGVDAYPQDFENFVQDWGGVRSAYEVIVFYNMHMAAPAQPDLEALAQLAASGQGIVVLHHAILAWPDVPTWSHVCGIADRSFGYHGGQTVRVDVADAGHPITQDLGAWSMTDETYTMADCGPDSHVLLTTDHPLSMRSLAWTRTCERSRVFCFQSGHDQATWAEPGFRTVLERGILWAAGRL